MYTRISKSGGRSYLQLVAGFAPDRAAVARHLAAFEGDRNVMLSGDCYHFPATGIVMTLSGLWRSKGSIVLASPDAMAIRIQHDATDPIPAAEITGKERQSSMGGSAPNTVSDPWTITRGIGPLH